MGDGDDGGTEPSRGGRALDLDRGWLPLAALALAVCLPILLAVVDAVRAHWYPAADAATIVHRSYDMWSPHRPLVGQYSLAGSTGAEQVFSPGPLLYVVLAPAARFGRGNPAKRTFQAIRIAVNDELAAIDAALPEAWEMLAPGGRLAAISFHSLEDRRVKRFLADRARGCVCPPEFPVCRCGLEPEAKLVTRGGIAPSAGEIADNPRSASAHLRVAVKLDRGEGG